MEGKKTERVQTNISHTHLKRLKSTNFSDSTLSPSGIFVLLINMMVRKLGYSRRSTLYIGRMSVNVIFYLKSTNKHHSHSFERLYFKISILLIWGLVNFFLLGMGYGRALKLHFETPHNEMKCVCISKYLTSLNTKIVQNLGYSSDSIL